jgi:DnaJ like chaperone protein
MLPFLFHRSYRAAILKRLDGTNPNTRIPGGGRTKQLLLEAMFLVMGKVAKMDGCVSSEEIKYATSIMQLMGLNSSDRKKAISCFEQGKRSDTQVSLCVLKLARAIGKKSGLANLFITIQCRHAVVKGNFWLKEKIFLRGVAEMLGIQKSEFNDICEEILKYSGVSNSNCFLDNAYRVLQLERDVENGEIRRAYLRMMSRYHPDKILRENLTKESVRLAQEKSTAIRNAYEAICGFRKIRV